MSATESPSRRANAGVKAPAKPPTPPAFEMPIVRQGQMVLWFPDQSCPIDEGFVAWVTKVGEQAISLAYIEDGAISLMPKSGVRHKRDPNGELVRQINQGCWDFTNLGPVAVEEIAEIRGDLNAVNSGLIDEIADLRKKVVELEQKTAAK